MFRRIIAIINVIAILLGVSFSLKKWREKQPVDGNDDKYSVAETKENPDSPIKEKTIIFLGSSVTYGASSKGESFADFLAKKDGIIAIKEAVSGTTLVENNINSYIPRMKNIDKNIKADCFICQLSTNDATLKMPLGDVKSENANSSYDTSTVAGAIEYIISYAKETWGCKVAFYTGTKYDSTEYAKMVELLYEIKEKWDIDIIDLWNNDMNNIPKKDYNFYMADPIHPKRAGYREWWLPEFEKYLFENI